MAVVIFILLAVIVVLTFFLMVAGLKLADHRLNAAKKQAEYCDE